MAYCYKCYSSSSGPITLSMNKTTPFLILCANQLNYILII